MVKPDLSKDHMLLIKSAEESGWPSVGTDLVTIPPLGTLNKDGESTDSESSAACEDDVAYKKSQPVEPGFEILYNHTAVTFKAEPDKIDSQDVSRPKRYIRGHDTYSGTLEWDKAENDNRVDEAANGHWNPDKLSIEPDRHFREFVLWSLRNPRDANDKITMNKSAIKCDQLHKHFGFLFDSSEISDEGAVRISTPVSRSFFRKFNMHTFPTDGQAIHTAVSASGSISPVDAQPREATRMNLKVSNVTGTGTVTVIGTNVFKQPVSVVFTVAGVSSLLSKKWIDTIDSIEISPGITDIDFILYDYDYTIKNPALK